MLFLWMRKWLGRVCKLRFIGGRPRADFPELCQWLGALRLARTNEQETEARWRWIHSLTVIVLYCIRIRIWISITDCIYYLFEICKFIIYYNYWLTYFTNFTYFNLIYHTPRHLTTLTTLHYIWHLTTLILIQYESEYMRLMSIPLSKQQDAYHYHWLLTRLLRFQGLHRSIAQIKARAPNASEAYISTECRIPTFQKSLESPMALAEMAAEHADLDSSANLAEVIAVLIGGPTCRPCGQISHSELAKLLYHSTFRFSRGETAQKALPTSHADQLRQKKFLGCIGRCEVCCKTMGVTQWLSDKILFHFNLIGHATCKSQQSKSKKQICVTCV